MKKRIEFAIADPVAALSLTNDYFISAGFKKVNQTEKEVSPDYSPNRRGYWRQHVPDEKN